MTKPVFSYLNLLTAWSLLILLLTLLPFSRITDLPEPSFELTDKLVHGCLFGIHSYFLAGFLKKDKRLHIKLFSSVVLFSFFFGLFIEVIQYFIPERSFEWLDLIANLTGILIGVFVFYIKFNFFTN